MKTLFTLAVLTAITLPALLIGQDGVARTGTLDLNRLIVKAGQPTSFNVYDGAKLVLKITPTGDVVFGEGVTPTEATRIFARELLKAWPQFCVSSPAVKAAYDLGTPANAWACDDPRYRSAVASGQYRTAYCRDSVGKLHVAIPDSGETK